MGPDEDRRELIRVERRVELSAELRDSLERGARLVDPELLSSVRRRLMENVDAELNVAFRYGPEGPPCTAPDQLPWMFRLGPCVGDSQLDELDWYSTERT